MVGAWWGLRVRGFWDGWGLARTEGSRFCHDYGLTGTEGPRFRGDWGLVETEGSRFRGGSGLVGTEGSKFWCFWGLGFEIFSGMGPKLRRHGLGPHAKRSFMHFICVFT